MKTERARSGLFGGCELIKIPPHSRPDRLPKFRKRRIRGDVGPAHNNAVIEDRRLTARPLLLGGLDFCFCHVPKYTPKSLIFQ